MEKRTYERGQIIIIIALAIVVLIGFTALAIDGSLIYSEKRNDQSVADSSALSGAGAAAQYLKTANMSGFACGGSVSAGAAAAAITQAQTTASKYGITLAANNISVSGVTTNCDTYNGRKYMDVTVVVTTTVTPRFLRIIRSTPISTSAQAVARVYINTSFAGGNAIYSTGSVCNLVTHKTDTTTAAGGVFVSGTSVINITGGGIYSSSCLSADGSARMLAYNGVMQYYGKGSQAFTAGSKTEYSVGNGLLFATNSNDFILNDPDTSSGPSIGSVLSSQSYQLWVTITANPNIDGSLWPTYTTQTITADMEDIVLPTCNSTPRTFPSPSSLATTTIYPGTYSSSASWGGWGGHTLKFTPGTYCFGGSLSLTNDTFTMDNVVIYFTGSGGIYFGGSNATAPSLNSSSIFINNGDFDLASGLTLHANNFMTYIKQGNFIIEGSASGFMNAPGCNTSACGVGPAIPGVLIYMAKTNTGRVDINGSGSMTATGTIYAPGSRVYVSGNSAAQTLNVQIIGKMVWVSGSSTITMDQTDATLYSQGSTTIQLLK